MIVARPQQVHRDLGRHLRRIASHGVLLPAGPRRGSIASYLKDESNERLRERP